MKYYIFGAGQNAYGTLDFFGRDNCISAVDNDSSRIGEKIYNVEIIDFQTFKGRYRGETVIITPLKYKDILSRQLIENGINNYYISPNFLGEFYNSPREIVENNGMLQMDRLFFFEKSIVAKRVAEYLLDTGYPQNKIIFIEDLNNLKENDAIFFFENELIADNPKVKTVNLSKKVCDSIKDVKKYKGIHQGKRCFVVLNGPSLRVEDLAKIKENEDFSFACGYITKMFDDTNWRPTYFIIIDNEEIFESRERLQMLQESGIQVFCRDVNGSKEKVFVNGAIYFNCITRTENFYFSQNVDEYVISPSTVAYPMLQFAAYMGFKEIYLIGADAGNIESHFYDANKFSDVKSMVKSSDLSDWIKAYEIAKEYAKTAGIKIHNASRGGYLEVFDRVDFDSLF